MASQDVAIPVDRLRGFAVGVFEALGMAARHADSMAEQITWAHIRGYPWLGARKIIQYGKRIQAGVAATHGQLTVVAETAALVAFDAGNSFSQITGIEAMQKVTEKARSSGVAAATVRNTSSASALGFFPHIAIAEGMIGVAINNGPPHMAPWGSRAKLIGNQAFALGSPAGRYEPIVMDTALSEETLVGLHGYQARGETLPEGVALASDGTPTTDPATALAGILLPIGRHKGSGLAIMWEVLTGVLAGGDRFMSDVTMPDVFDRPQGISMFFLAIDPTIVMPYQVFVDRVDDLIERIRSSAPVEGVDQVRVPGERAAERARQAQQNGVTLSPELYADLKLFGEDLGVVLT